MQNIISILGFFIVLTLAITLTSQSAQACSNMLIFQNDVFAQENTYVYPTPKDTIPYPIQDRPSDFFTDSTQQENNLNLNDPTVIQKEVIYDPETNQYIILERIGDDYYRDPQYLTFKQYMEMQHRKAIEEYWRQRANANSVLEGTGIMPKMYSGDALINRIFGGTTIDIRPSGNVDLTLGGNWQHIRNPQLLERQRKTGNLDFDMNINLNVIGKIGDKLKLQTAYNTQATFNFENQVKLEHTGNEDEIIQKLEAGNVSMPLKSTLIQGSQSLMGFKTQLKFGRMTVTGLLSQQQSKAENIRVEGGAQTRNFELFSDQYEDNKHFFLSQYFRNGNPTTGNEGYENALKTAPLISSFVEIKRIEIWVTNTRNITENTRDIVGFMDLGEHEPYSIMNMPGVDILPSNNANDLYKRLITAGDLTRKLDNVVATLQGADFGLQPVQDFEKTRAYKLSEQEYSYNPKLGTIHLNISLKPAEVLAVAYQYAYNGAVFQVGEFSQDVPIDTAGNKVLFLKMLKSTSIRTQLPIWDLMMKNIYSLGAFQVNKEDFRLDVVYMDPGGGEKRYLPEGAGVQGIPLISLLGIDKLNLQNDPEPDGIFDFNELTINTQNGRIIFPVLEPFGSTIRNKFPVSQPDLANKYAYDSLYRSSKAVALQFPEKNRYKIKGTYKSTFSNEISLGAFNVPKGSVRVTAGGQVLKENIDYSIDYNLGKVKILNDGILNSGVPINVSYEDPALIGFQVKRLMGTRIDYQVNKDIALGATYMQLSERPFTRKINIGEDPINNRIVGIDGNYTTEIPWLTRWVDKLPLLATKEMSTLNFNAEGAMFIPGHNKIIGKNGIVYVDDFEGAASEYDMRFPITAWTLASTPSKALDPYGQVMFPEADSINQFLYNVNRSRCNWYNIDPVLTGSGNNTPDHLVGNALQQQNPYVIQWLESELFPNRSSTLNTPIVLSTFDMAYTPKFRGPYNFDAININPDGSLQRRTERWGGIMRAIDQNDFENTNVEYIRFWMMDPFVFHQDTGQLYINLGSISEDILKDSRQFFENALPKDQDPNKVDTTIWSAVPKYPPINNQFDNDPDARTIQDVGYDGFNDDIERKQNTTFLSAIEPLLTPEAMAELQTDPCSDNYHHYRGNDYDAAALGILDRYRNINGPQNNSPITTSNQDFINSSSMNPDMEDLNRDYTLNETEEYFQYRIELKPDMQKGDNYIIDRITINKNYNGSTVPVTWYQFQIPIQSYERKVGGIQDFRSIRFIRMYMTRFDTSLVCRFARMDLVRNQWRRYQLSLLNPGEYLPDDQSDDTYFNIGAVNIEENSNRAPIPYTLPPGIQREFSVGATPSVQQNEQSLSMHVCNLKDGDSRAIFKTLNLDLRMFERMKLFVHAEELPGAGVPLANGDLHAFVRIGADFISNYYEYEIPLKVTTPTSDAELIWPTQNQINILLDSLTKVKLLRNSLGGSYYLPYSVTDANGNKITVIGSPELGRASAIMMGVRNHKNDGSHPDDGLNKCAELWWNEMRLEGFDEKVGYAAIARADIKLADLGQVNLSGTMHTQGFGGLEQKLQNRYRDNYYAYDASTSIELGKIFPKSAGVKIPMYAGIQQSYSIPQFDPYDTDILLKDKIETNKVIQGKEAADSIRRIAHTKQTLTSINFTNIRKDRKADSKPKIYDISNFNVSYSYNNLTKSTPILEADKIEKHHGAIAYNYSVKPKYIQPFTKLIKSETKYFKWFRDFNFNPIPSDISIRTELDRDLGKILLRKLTQDPYPFNASYIKNFTWSRIYGFKFDFTKSIKIDYTATNQSRIDERKGKPRNGFEVLDTLQFKEKYEPWGRTTNYTHNMNSSYNLPIDKFPFLEWIKIRTSYNITYGWIGASRQPTALNLKNTINNTQVKQINSDLDLKKLYDIIPFLKEYNKSQFPSAKKKDHKDGAKTEGDKKGGKGSVPKPDEAPNSDMTLDKKELKKKTPNHANPLLAMLIKPIISLKKITFTYSENGGTTLPGFMHRPKYMGMNVFQQFAPGYEFVFGGQYDNTYEAWLDNIANNANWITRDTILNQQYLKNKTRDLQVKALFEPYYDLRIDVNITRNLSKNHSQLFKIRNGEFQHLVPTDKGAYSFTYITLPTMFSSEDKFGNSELFAKFENYRKDIINRLIAENPYYNIAIYDTSDHVNHYGIYQQDVLIPAFMAAYTGRQPSNVKLNIFKYIPLPNWRITYNGLSYIPALKEIIQSINISHGYSSSVNVGNFFSNLNYRLDSLDYDYTTGYLYNYDTLTNNFYPIYNIPQITISEQLAPLIGIDIAFKKPRLTTKIEYKKSRQLGMSFVDYQLVESRNEDISLGIGYKVKGITLPFIKHKGVAFILKNDLNFRFDFSIRDNVTTNRKLDQKINDDTKGSRTIRIAPSIDYMINQRLNLKLFYDRTDTKPKTAQSPPITNTRGGLTIRFTLGQ